MPIFAHIDHEDEVQLNDRTRLDVSKSFITANEAGGFNQMTVKPGADEVEVSVYNSTTSSRYLDWEYQALKIDIDSTNNKIDFKEGSTQYTATLTSGTYTLATLATEIETQLDATGGDYTVSVDSDDKITILGAQSFDLQLDGPNKNTVLTRQLFFDEDELTGKTSYTSDRIEYLTRKLTAFVGENRTQVQTIATVANTSNAINSKYFLLWEALDAEKFYVWFNSSAGGVDPAITGATGIEVAITNGDTASQVATALASALDARVEFISTAATSTVTVTNAASGFSTPSREGLSTGFTFTVTTYGQTQVSESSYIKVYSEAGDRLFSTDAELESEEPEIRRYVKLGRNTFKDVHRAAQKKILEWLDRQGYVNIFDEKFTKWAIVDITEVREWARYMALRIIFEGNKNALDDVFTQKRAKYESDEIQARQRAILRLDTDNDNEVPAWEGTETNSISLWLR